MHKKLKHVVSNSTVRNVLDVSQPCIQIERAVITVPDVAEIF